MPCESSSPLPIKVDFSTVADLRPAIERVGWEHWNESGFDREVAPLVPDWDSYLLLERGGVYRCIAASRGGEVVGYAGYIVTKPLHAATTVCAFNVSVYCIPSVRSIAWRIVKFAERSLGAKIIRYEAPLGAQWSMALSALGYPRIASVHSKVVG